MTTQTKHPKIRQCRECFRVQNPNTGEFILDFLFIAYGLTPEASVEVTCPQCAEATAEATDLSAPQHRGKGDRVKAYELLSDPAKWTKGDYAKDSSGEGVKPNSEKAVCWCMLGALLVVYQDYCDYLLTLDRSKKALSKFLGVDYPDIGVFNDDPATTHAMGLEVLRRADV